MPKLQRRIIKNTCDEKTGRREIIVEVRGYPRLTDAEVRYLRCHPAHISGMVVFEDEEKK